MSLTVEGLEDLNDHHHDQIQDYLTYCRKKREVLLKEIQITIEEEEATRLLDPNYTREEVEDILSGLSNILKSNINNEMMVIDRCNALLVRQLFTQAQWKEFSLHADLAALENHQLLAGMAKYEELLNVRGPTKKLDGVGLDAERGVQMSNEINALKDENEQLRDRLAKLQEQCANIMRSKSSLSEELDSVQQKYEQVVKDFDMIALSDEQKAKLLQSGQSALADLAAQGANDSASLQAEIDRMAEMLEQKEQDMRDMERQLVARVQDTAPFQNMKRMVGKKNRVIKDLHGIIEELGGEEYLDRLADQDDDH